MKVSLRLLQKLRACDDGIEFYKKVGQPKTIKGCIKTAIEHNELKYASWFIVRCMDKIQCVQYAVFAAEQVLSIFENRYPNDKRPRKAIEAARQYIENPSKENANAANATYATYAAYVADAAAAYVADAAADTAYADALRIKILNYGLEILGENK